MQTVTMPLPLAGKNGIFYGTAQQLGERIGRHATTELCNIAEYRRTKFDVLFNMTGMLCSTIIVFTSRWLLDKFFTETEKEKLL